tara:strand:- start:965 stop:1345 length:381 start_codon:yes stop_codon:yes gene_type:complete
MSAKPKDGEIRAVNYTDGTMEDGQRIIQHRIEQYYSGEWRAISVYQEDKDGNLLALETDRLRAKKKQIYEDLKDAVEREWVGLTRAERFEIEKAMSKYYDYQHECKTVCLPEFAAAIEAKLKEKNT